MKRKNKVCASFIHETYKGQGNEDSQTPLTSTQCFTGHVSSSLWWEVFAA